MSSGTRGRRFWSLTVLGACGPSVHSGRQFALLCLFSVVLMVMALTHPNDDWDMIGYVAAAHYGDGLRGEDLRRRTFADVREAVSADTFAYLTGGEGHFDAYGRTVHQDAISLEQHVPLYSVRIAYVGLMRLVGRTGLTYPQAGFAISAVAAAISLVLLGLIGRRARVPVWLVPLIAVSTGYYAVAKLPTPDALACLVSLTGLLLLMSRRYSLASLVAALLPLVRSDFILLSLLLLLVPAREGRRGPALLAVVGAVTAYLYAMESSGHYGWLKIFNFTLIHMDPHPADMALSADVHQYVRAYVNGVYGLLYDPHFPVFLCAALTAVSARIDWRSRYVWFVLPTAFTALHLLLFPAYMSRFFVFAASVAFVGVIACIRDGTHAALLTAVAEAPEVAVTAGKQHAQDRAQHGAAIPDAGSRTSR